MKQVEIYGYVNESSVEPFATKTVATQQEGYIAIEQLKKLGCGNIVANFDELESLPKNYDELEGTIEILCSSGIKVLENECESVCFDCEDFIFLKKLVDIEFNNTLDKSDFKSKNNYLNDLFVLSQKLSVLTNGCYFENK